MKASQFLPIYAVCIPIGHAIGRVGCFLGGCCYGRHYDGFLSHTYGSEYKGIVPDADIGVPVMPVQLIEAACLVLLFGVLLFIFLKWPQRKMLPVFVYVAAYALIRFVLEFLRGDAIRGGFLGLSTSQWISLGLLVVLAAILIWNHQKKKKSEATAAEQNNA